MALNLEYALRGDNLDAKAASRNFLRLASLVIGTGELNLELRFGVESLTWAAAVNSGANTVTHGLGRTPAVVFACAKDSPQTVAGQIPVCNPSSYNATDFTLDAETAVAYTGNQDVVWIAIG